MCLFFDLDKSVILGVLLFVMILFLILIWCFYLGVKSLSIRAAEMAVPAEPFGTKPSDSFQEYAEPYNLWSTREYVVTNSCR